MNYMTIHLSYYNLQNNIPYFMPTGLRSPFDQSMQLVAATHVPNQFHKLRLHDLSISSLANHPTCPIRKHLPMNWIQRLRTGRQG
jgi:hypothetical protein